MSARWKGILPALSIALLLLLTLLFFQQLAFSGKILARGDTYNYFYPYWDARNQAFRAGELPLWTNDLFMGAPLLANPQIGSYYPPNWLTAPLRAPSAISISILLHIALAAAGTCWLYRLTISAKWLPALAAGISFAFGGYLGAHVEQINQLQGLAWMPILFALYHRLLKQQRPLRDALLLALAWALQIFSGHTQTVFISGVGLGIYGLAQVAGENGDRKSTSLRLLLSLAIPFLLALLLALPQLLPSLELLRLSNRGGGFTTQEATAFSLPPAMLGRALLPSYDGQLFGEYVTTIGLSGLALALWGMTAQQLPRPQRRTWLLIALLGLALALGRYNPLYLLLAELPGFNLFRVPARFLALFSLALAMLGGLGVEALHSHPTSISGHRRRLKMIGITGALLLLIAATATLPPDPSLIFGESQVSPVSLLLWLGAGLITVALFSIHQRRWTPIAAVALLITELLLAAQNLPYNDLAPPEGYLGQRFTISQMLAFQAEQNPPGRVLSISQLYFDPGDIAALRQDYDRLGLDAASQFHALDSIKKQEMLLPNLPLTWGIPSIDGFGGGIMPTRAYSQFSSLLSPPDVPPAVDGRLSERLALPACRGACIPDLRWLQATDTRYLITDRVYDVWHDDIAYDTALARFWRDVSAIEPSPLGDQIHILHSGSLAATPDTTTLPDGLSLTITDWAGLQSHLQRGADILAVTAVNSRHPQIQQQLQPPPFERVLSSDIKIYRLPSMGRAYLATDPLILPDDLARQEAALQLLQNGQAIVINGAAPPLPGDATDEGSISFIGYDATRVELKVSSPAAAYLILGDAHYPGWEATVNGAPTPIYRANLIFRALPLPAGDSSVVFRFEPHLWRAALYIGITLWMIALLLCLVLWRQGRNAPP